MKKSFLICICIIFIAVQGLTAEKKVTLTSTEAPPYSGEKLKNQGVSIDIIRAAFNIVGYKIKVKFFPLETGLGARFQRII